jgi:hypothetical protein
VRLVLLGSVLAAVLPTFASGADEPGLTQVGFFRPAVANPAYKGNQADYLSQLRMRLDERSRDILTFDAFGGVAAYNLDTLAPRSPGVLALPGYAHVMLVQQALGRTLVATATGTRETATGEIDAVRVVAGRPTLAGKLTLGPADLGPGMRHVVAMAEQPQSPYVYLLTSAGSPTAGALVPGTLSVTAVDLTGLEAGHAKVLWTTGVPDCVRPTSVGAVDDTPEVPAAFGYSPHTHALFFGCSAPDAFVGKVPDPVGVGRLVLVPGAAGQPPSAGGFSLFAFPGVVAGLGSWDSGSERLVLETGTPSTGTTGYVFDARTTSYIGGVGLGQNALNTLAVDQAHGRLYGFSQNTKTGIVVSDLAPVPVDLGHVYPQFSTISGQFAGGNVASVDSATGRVFASYGTAGFAVLRDTVPYYRAPVVADPDAGTSNLPERPDRTAADFAAAAQGYGAVVRQVGGTHNLLFNALPVEPHADPIGGGTRELDLAYLTKLSLDDNSASAATIAADRDKANTQADEQSLHQVTPSPQGTSSPQGPSAHWPYAPVQCGDFGGAPKSAGTASAHVACDSARSTVSSGAIAGPSEVTASTGDPLMQVGATSYASSADRTALKGASATVTSTVKAVSILGGVLQVGEVQVTAVARAHGRPGTAGGSFVRRISGVVLNGVDLCDAQCDPEAVAEQVNSALAGRLHLSFPAPDPGLAKGSPRGAVTVIRRQLEQQTEAQLLDQQDPTRQEVPGMVVTLYQDNNVPARTVMMFAGASVEAHYLIYPLTAEGPTSPVPAGPAAPGVVLPVPAPVGQTPPDVAVGGNKPQTAPPAAGVVDRVASGIRLVLNGFSVVWRLFGVWLVLLLPVHLSARRWLLLRRASLEEGAA